MSEYWSTGHHPDRDIDSREWLPKRTGTLADHVSNAWSAAGNQAQAQPQMLVSILPDKDLRAYQTIIQTSTFHTKFKEMMEAWLNPNGGKLPESFILVTVCLKGQYQHVLQQEVQDMKTLVNILRITQLQFVMVIGSKRHRVRFFPERGDGNGNAFPGTLVETGAAHPFENDCYLCGRGRVLCLCITGT